MKWPFDCKEHLRTICPIVCEGRSHLAYHACRFVTLVDVLYENRIRLFCSAEDDPMQLFRHIVSVADARRATKSEMVYLLVFACCKVNDQHAYQLCAD